MLINSRSEFIDHLLIIRCGGPNRPEEIVPFLENVTRGLSIPAARLREVTRHYEAIGGSSPYNPHTFQFAASLTRCLRGLGVNLPVFVGMRHWQPFLSETIQEIESRGLKHGLGFILAAHRSVASFDRYVQALEQAIQKAQAHELSYATLEPWHKHPLFIEAQADYVRAVLNQLPADVRQAARLIFSAHSIPQAMAQPSHYDPEVRNSSLLVAQALEHSHWSVAYQSRSGRPEESWLEPEVHVRMRQLAQEGVADVVFVPIGFLCDHAEVLYDLDMEARAQAKQLGLRYWRASTVIDHPKFVEMVATLVSSSMPQAQETGHGEKDRKIPRPISGRI